MKLITAAVLSLIPVCAAADNYHGFYLGGGGGIVSFEDSSSVDADLNDIDLNAIELFGGYKYNSALGIELRVGTNFSEREISSEVEDAGVTHGLEREVSIDHYQSLYYRPELANEVAKLYGLIGYSQLEYSSTTVNATGGTFGVEDTSESESGFSYGVGIGFVINADFNINFEYRRLIDKKDYEVELAGINFDYRF